jgi:DnaJ-class molecular chaperone
MDATLRFVVEIELEVVCANCKGAGGWQERRHWAKCASCEGAGYLPTEPGNKFLALMRHELRRLKLNPENE